MYTHGLAPSLGSLCFLPVRFEPVLPLEHRGRKKRRPLDARERNKAGTWNISTYSIPADRCARVGDRLQSVHVNPLRDRADTLPKRATFPVRYRRLSFVFFALCIDSIYCASLSRRTAPPVEGCPVGNCTYLFGLNLFRRCYSLQRAMQKRFGYESQRTNPRERRV